MWTCVTVVYLIAGAVFTARLLSPHRPEGSRFPQFDSRRIAVGHADPRGWRLSEMSHRSALAEVSSVAAQERHCGRSTLISDYWALTKPEVNVLILITTFVGFYLASASTGRPFSFAGLFNTLLGTLLVASGTGALNQYLERRFDAQMRRTARRPAAAGRLTPSASLGLRNSVGNNWQHLSCDRCQPARERARGFDVADVSVLVHAAETKNPIVRSRRCFSRCHAAADWVGCGSWSLRYRGGLAVRHALPLAVSPLHGNRLDVSRRLCRAGYLVLPKGNARVPSVTLETLLPLLALVAISILQFPTRHAATFYCAAALLGTGFTYFGWQFVLERSRVAARRLLTASIVYLPLVYGLSATLCNRAR